MSRRKDYIHNEQNYIKSLEEQLSDINMKEHFSAATGWRLKQAESYRKMYYSLQWLQIIFGFLIVVLGAFQGGCLGIAITIIGGLSCAVSLIKSLYRCYENWKRYRIVLEDIKSLTRIYLSENEPFKAGDLEANKKLYLLMLDNIIRTETHEWKAMRDENTQVNDQK